MGIARLRTLWQKRRYIHRSDVWDLCKILLSCPCGKVLRLFRRHIWLISERENDARDNGYWLFAYIRTRYPDKPVYYPIRFSAPDYAKIQPLGNALRYGSFRHHIYFWAAEKNISAHVGNGFPAPFMCRQFLMAGFYSFQNIFLQHGIIKDILPFLMREVNRIDLFVCSTRAEADAVVRDMGFRPEQVAVLGLCRFDGLNTFTVRPGQILIMPTWRWWLNPAYGQSAEEANAFIANSLYVKTYNELLSNARFRGYLRANGLHALFFLHHQMQPFLADFVSGDDHITLASAADYDVQTALKESAFLVTDYSSIFFDFAYMNKPLVYFQFDYAEYREKHYPEGYFHYDRDGFGPIVKTVDELVDELIAAHQSGFAMSPVYQRRVDAFFEFRDSDNCKRNYEAIAGFDLPHFKKG